MGQLGVKVSEEMRYVDSLLNLINTMMCVCISEVQEVGKKESLQRKEKNLVETSAQYYAMMG